MEHEILTLSLDDDNDDIYENDDPELVDIEVECENRRSSVGYQRSHHCVISAITVLILVIVASFVALLAVGCLVVAPYIQAQGFQYSSCVPMNVLWGHDNHTCICGKGCQSYYPCIRIIVMVVTEDSNDVNANLTRLAMLSEDVSVIKRQVS